MARFGVVFFWLQVEHSMLPWLIMANTDKRDGIKKSSIGMMMTTIIMIEGKKGAVSKKVPERLQALWETLFNTSK